MSGTNKKLILNAAQLEFLVDKYLKLKDICPSQVYSILAKDPEIKSQGISATREQLRYVISKHTGQLPDDDKENVPDPSSKPEKIECITDNMDYEEVAGFLYIKFPDLSYEIDKLKENFVDGSTYNCLSIQDLKDMGITKVGLQHKLLRAKKFVGHQNVNPNTLRDQMAAIFNTKPELVPIEQRYTRVGYPAIAELEKKIKSKKRKEADDPDIVGKLKIYMRRRNGNSFKYLCMLPGSSSKEEFAPKSLLKFAKQIDEWNISHPEDSKYYDDPEDVHPKEKKSKKLIKVDLEEDDDEDMPID